jgi:shikimate dehydrogenase
VSDPVTSVHARLAVLGSPIAHSRSPKIHAAAYRELGLDWSYTAIECVAGELAAQLDGMDDAWRGLSLTMPLKEEAHRLAARLDPVATDSGVVNTLLRDATLGGWIGFNTDVVGLAAALGNARADGRETIVLGAGATAVSAVLSARQVGAERVTVLARRPEVAQALVARLQASGGGSAELIAGGLTGPVADWAVASATLVISTLPGHAGTDTVLPPGIETIPLVDVAYDPWPSPLANRWRHAGGTAESGIDMLVFQALVQVRIFVNGDPTAQLPEEAVVLAAMRAAGVGR